MATPLTVEELYERYIRVLTPQQKIHLLAKIATELAESRVAEKPQSILELHGLGAEVWREIDIQAYIDQLRSEWDHHP
ncbi:MAG: hypothetical protein KatS3mg016_0952 [Fimbriimonadales bacterium]|nr:MAG: hypothetical protein KatS3mg016_0952 [Fimbriimonadales bacterium]